MRSIVLAVISRESPKWVCVLIHAHTHTIRCLINTAAVELEVKYTAMYKHACVKLYTHTHRDRCSAHTGTPNNLITFKFINTHEHPAYLIGLQPSKALSGCLSA